MSVLHFVAQSSLIINNSQLVSTQSTCVPHTELSSENLLKSEMTIDSFYINTHLFKKGTTRTLISLHLMWDYSCSI